MSVTTTGMSRAAHIERDGEELVRLHRQMHRIRAFEDAGARQLAQGRLSGTLHLSSGQEAVAVGVCSQLQTSDSVASTHRGHGHCLAKGADPREMMAELFGAATGSCKGRSGSMHIADSRVGILGANGIVGGGMAMAVGAALSAQVLGNGAVAVCFFGEGAAAEGSLHESLNLASLWRLPVVFVCENNLYAELSPVSEVLAVDRVADLGTPFGIPAERRDGNDVVEVVGAASEAVDRARDGGGPSLLEFMTYRHSGHYEGDPKAYRSREEEREWAARDPLDINAARLRDLGVAAEVIEAISRDAEREMEAAVEWAMAQPPASEASMTEDVYGFSGEEGLAP